MDNKTDFELIEKYFEFRGQTLPNEEDVIKLRDDLRHRCMCELPGNWNVKFAIAWSRFDDEENTQT